MIDHWDPEDRGPLDVKKLSGNWRNIYDIHNTEESECVTVKLEEVSGNKTQLNLFQGSFYNFPDPEDPMNIERKMVYDDSVLLTFNHAEDTSIAAMSIMGEDEDQMKAEYLAQFDIPTLKGEQMQSMTNAEVAEYDA